MAKSVLDIVIRTIKQGGADKETITQLVSVKSAILDAAAAGGALVAAGYTIKKALDETIGTLVAYADQVRTVQNATGASAEDASKLIQILDDQKVSYEQLQKVIQANGKAYDFSIEGIARMSDEYLQLKTSQEQAAFMQERYGKQWLSFVPVMKQGGQAIREAADATGDGLVLTQQAVDQAREYEMGMDALNDSVTALKLEMAQGLLPTVVKATVGLAHSNEIRQEANRLMQEGIAHNREEALSMASATIQQQAYADAAANSAAGLDEESESAKENAAAIKEASAAHQSMLGLITNIASETRNYNEKQAELTQKMAENRAEAEALYPWQKTQLDELNQKYADMSATYDANAAAHNAAMGKIQYDLLVTKLSADGLTDAEYQMAQQAGLMFGVFDQSSVNTANNMNLVTQAVTDGRLSVEDMGKALDMLPTMKSIDVVINALVHTASDLVTGHEQGQGMQGGYAEGGISTGPASGHMELLHGTEAVIPLQNGSIPVQMQGAPAMSGGNTNINVQLTISSPMTILDQQTAQNMLLPFIINGVREAKSRGAL